MATKRIKDITNTAASVASDAYLAIDGTSNGSEKITRDNFRKDTADAFVAAPGTYNLAPLSGGAVEVAKGGTGATTAAGARTNLGVNGIDEDAQANALKTTAPALYFNGSSSVVTVAHDSKLNFTDGSNDLPFSVSAWINASDCTNFQIVNKDDTSANRDWSFDITSGDDLRFIVLTDASNYEGKITATALTGYEGQWIHVAATFGGAGPDYASALAAAEDAVTLYVNGQAVAMATGSAGTHTGMPGGTAPVLVGKRGSSLHAKGSIRDVKIFNRSLTASEIAQLARGNDLGFADEWGGATATSGTLTVGKRYRLRDWITGDDFTNVGAGSNADGVEFVATGTTPTTWTNSSVVESIGTLADFRAERYDTRTNKLYCLSDNAFVGTGTSVSLTGREVPVYSNGTWTPSITFGGGSTGMTYAAQEGAYTRIGNTCFVTGVVTLSAVGSDTGTARLAGLPFVNHNMTATSYGSSSVVAFDMTGLTSVVNLLNEDNQPNAILYDSGATGATAVTEANFTATSSVRFSMTYQIQ